MGHTAARAAHVAHGTVMVTHAPIDVFSARFSRGPRLVPHHLPPAGQRWKGSAGGSRNRGLTLIRAPPRYRRDSAAASPPVRTHTGSHARARDGAATSVDA